MKVFEEQTKILHEQLDKDELSEQQKASLQQQISATQREKACVDQMEDVQPTPEIQSKPEYQMDDDQQGGNVVKTGSSSAPTNHEESNQDNNPAGGSNVQTQPGSPMGLNTVMEKMMRMLIFLSASRNFPLGMPMLIGRLGFGREKVSTRLFGKAQRKWLVMWFKQVMCKALLVFSRCQTQNHVCLASRDEMRVE